MEIKLFPPFAIGTKEKQIIYSNDLALSEQIRRIPNKNENTLVQNIIVNESNTIYGLIGVPSRDTTLLKIYCSIIRYYNFLTFYQIYVPLL